MMSFFKRLWQDRRANALVIAAGGLPLVIGSAGLATDTVQWALWKRQLQRAADSAAMAGVYAKASGKTLDNCANISTATYDKPIAYDVKKNNHVAINTTCTAENSPTSGAYVADPYAVRVTLAVQKRLSFSSMFMSSVPTISATATATIVPGGKYCVISLENTSATGITATGSADVDLGCGMITNSTSMTAAVATGSSEVDASPIAAVGGIAASNNWADDVVLNPFTLAQDDPFGSVPPPSTFPNGNCPNVIVNPNQTTTLDPGCFGNMTLKGTVVLNPGTYVLDGGSLSIESQANVQCNGCTIVLTSRTAATNPSSIGNVTINGGAEIDMSAPDTGTYKGILIYQDRRALNGTSANQQSKINGNADSAFQGAFYFPSQQVTFNGTAGMDTDCMQLVARTVVFSGNMDISNNCPSSSASQAFNGRKIRLVE
jgi:hypothetical protein